MGLRTMFRPSFIAAALALLTGIMFGASAAIAAEPIKIGFSMPLTGGLASNGKAILAAYQMWEEDINAKGGLLGRPVKLIYYDDQSNPSLVPAIYAKLFDIDKIDLVFTSYGTNLSVPSMPVVIPRNYGTVRARRKQRVQLSVLFFHVPGGAGCRARVLAWLF